MFTVRGVSYDMCLRAPLTIRFIRPRRFWLQNKEFALRCVCEQVCLVWINCVLASAMVGCACTFYAGVGLGKGLSPSGAPNPDLPSYRLFSFALLAQMAALQASLGSSWHFRSLGWCQTVAVRRFSLLPGVSRSESWTPRMRHPRSWTTPSIWS